jgi:hypothetical protein
MIIDSRIGFGRWPGSGKGRSVALGVIVCTAIAGLVGCASPPGGQEGADFVCNSAQQCRVTVEVACAQGACRASVDHPRVLSRGNDVVWILVNKPGQSYVFATNDGIAFKTEAGRNVFNCHREANGERFACLNRKTPGEYEYAVRIAGTPAVPPLDPWIVN